MERAVWATEGQVRGKQECESRAAECGSSVGAEWEKSGITGPLNREARGEPRG